MENDLFPSRIPDLPLADRSPRLEMRPDGMAPETDNRPPESGFGGCGCHSKPNCGSSQGNGGHSCTGYEGYGTESWGLAEYPLAMVYAPCQVFRAIYDPATALNRGTLFTELDLPLGGEGGFTAVGSACRVERRRV